MPTGKTAVSPLHNIYMQDVRGNGKKDKKKFAETV